MQEQQCPEPVSSAELLGQVEKIAHSAGFCGADILRNLLLYLAQEAVEHPGEGVREAELAVQVLGRRDFDARIDSGVRVHAARLRAKLAEYYVNEGATDPIILEIPKRSYQLCCRHRDVAPAPLPEPAPAVSKRSRPRWVWASAIVATVGLLALGAEVVIRTTGPSDELRLLWTPFFDMRQPTTVVFATPRLYSSAQGLSWVPQEVPPGTTVISEYTGVGELSAISRLTHLFDHAGRDIHLKRSDLVTWDDARQQNLVLVGGPSTNAVLDVLPKPSRFAFGSGPPDERGTRHVAIEDLRAAPGKPRYYMNSGRPFTYDHAIIAFVPTAASGRSFLTLAGSTTMGTQAAAEFVTDPQSVKRLMAALRVKSSPVPGFEALIKVSLRDGSPVSIELVAAHRT